MRYQSLEKLFSSLPIHQNAPTINLVLCAAADEHSLQAVFKAYHSNIITPILVGNKKKIESICAKNQFSLENIQIYDVTDEQEMVQTAVKLIRDDKGQLLMKGKLATSKLMSGVLNKDWGIRVNQLISHFALFDLPEYHKLLAVSDVAMNIAPTLQEKIEIINNAVLFFKKLHIDTPKVAVIAAVESVNERMQATLDAALLSIMNRRGQIKNCLIDGPLAFDNAIDKESKNSKEIAGVVAGDADMLLVPDIEAGNVLYKSFVYFAKAHVAALVLGAKVPIVLTSRADTEETKFNSISLAVAALRKEKK